jgi:hypothetical protein
MSGFANRGPQDAALGGSFSGGPQLFDPTIAASGAGHSYASNVTAKAGGGRASATKVTTGVVRIAVCATAADSIALPPAAGGQWMVIYNAGAAACQVFADPATSDTINGVAAATGVSLAAAKSAWFCSAAQGVWFWNLSA